MASQDSSDIRDSDAVVVDDEGRPRFRIMEVNKGGAANEDTGEDH